MNPFTKTILRKKPRKIFWLFLMLTINCDLMLHLSYYKWDFSIQKQFSWSSSTWTTPAYVITIKGHDQRVPIVTSLFKKYADLDLLPYYGIHGNAVYNTSSPKGLKPGEIGLRETMKNFFKMTIRMNYSEVFLFEDDAIPHLNFTAMFKQLPNRCREADVLLLGAIMWRRPKYWPSGICFDANTVTFGSYALFVKRSAYTSIVRWLQNDKKLPFDNMYPHLQKQGITVRVAYPPFLVIPEISHASLIDNNRNKIQFNIKRRIAIHDWKLDNHPLFKIPV